MKPNNKKVQTALKATREQRAKQSAEGGASGALAGAALGIISGPPGVVAGAMVGGVVGAVVGAMLDEAGAAEVAHTRVLDGEMGVSEGNLGAPNLEHPPAKVGAYSAASAGAGSGSSDRVPAEGPMDPPRD